MMSRILNPSKNLKISLKRDKVKEVLRCLDEEYNRTADDLQKYQEIGYRVTSKFIKITCAGYERMLNIKSYKINSKKVEIIADSIVVQSPNVCIIQNNITLKYPLTDDCGLLDWSWERNGGGTYNSSDWASLLFRGLRCKEIKTI